MIQTLLFLLSALIIAAGIAVAFVLRKKSSAEKSRVNKNEAIASE